MNDKKTPVLSKTEDYIRKILGVIIIVIALPFTIFFATASTGLSLLSILTIVVIFGIYILRNKGYHSGKDLFFVLIGFVAYVLPAPIFLLFFGLIAPLPMLKGFVITADWANEGVGIAASTIPTYVILSMLNILFFSSALFLFASDILFKIKPIVNSNRRSRIAVLAFLVIFCVVFTLPWLQKVETGSGRIAGAYGPGLDSSIMLALGHENTTMNFDAEKGVYIYQLELINTNNTANAEIIGLKGKVGSKTVQIAPPFGDNIEIINGNKTSDKIIIGSTSMPRPPEQGKHPAVKPALLRIYSKEPLLLITWIEQNNKNGWQVSFWGD